MGAKRSCRYCLGTKFYKINRSRTQRSMPCVVYRCRVCKTVTSEKVFAGFKRARLSIEKCQLLTKIVTDNPEITIRELAKQANVSHKTAWLWKKRVLLGYDAVKGYFQGKTVSLFTSRRGRPPRKKPVDTNSL